MTKIEKAQRAARDAFFAEMSDAFHKKFSVRIGTRYNLLSMEHITERTDEKPFTLIQHAWIGAYEQGFRRAISIVVREGRA